MPDFAAKVECWSNEGFVEQGEDVSVGPPGIAGESLEECEFLGGFGGKFEDVLRPFESTVECESKKDGIRFVGEGRAVDKKFGDCVGGVVLISGECDGGTFGFGWISVD